MIQLPAHISPDQNVLAELNEYQKGIDSLATFEQKSAKAKKAFSSKNKIGNHVFDSVKEKLIEMCSGARRCAYCEDSVGDEVEHIHPKDLYPSLCFNWDNYLYACGNCNGPKNNKFAVFRNDNGKFQKVNPPHGQQATEPPAGEDVMINPRTENPLDYCMLDLTSTFEFVVIAKDSKGKQRAEYTFEEVLRLNQREHLRIARKNAYANYYARFNLYNQQKTNGASQEKLEETKFGIQSEAHPTVWKEMQRYHKRGVLVSIDAELDLLFVNNPEAIDW